MAKTKKKKPKRLTVKELKRLLDKAPEEYKVWCGCGTPLQNCDVEHEDKQVLLWGKN